MEPSTRSSSSRLWVTVSVVLTSVLISQSDAKVCSRDQSRVVAKVVRERIFPVYNALQIRLDLNCKFALERDMYAIQEDHKVLEGSSRWTCDFCGKAFVSEFFLDRHFENRHEDQIQAAGSICLADVCDVFRCDIISGISQPDYWDIALCLEDDMKELHSQCEALVDECIPPGLTKNETETVHNHVMEEVCSYLTCSKYWNTPYQEMDNSHTALTIVLTTMSCFGILVYNFVFYNYFYSDLVDTPYDPTPKTKHRIKSYKQASASDISRQARQRATTLELEPA